MDGPFDTNVVNETGKNCFLNGNKCYDEPATALPKNLDLIYNPAPIMMGA